MKYKIKRTNKFTIQYAKLLKQNNFKEEEFIKVLELLIHNQPLPLKYHNHLLNPKSKRNLGMSHTTRYIIRISKRWQRINITVINNWFSFKFILMNKNINKRKQL